MKEKLNPMQNYPQISWDIHIIIKYIIEAKLLKPIYILYIFPEKNITGIIPNTPG